MQSGKPQLMQLTPNSNCSAVGSGDINNSTVIEFMSPPSQLVCWSTVVSVAFKTMILPNDNCCRQDYLHCDGALVTFQKGLTITYQPSGDGYYVLLNGKIVDAGQTYNFNNLAIYVSTVVETVKVPAKKS